MEVDGVGQSEQFLERVSLRDIESEKLIVVQMARGQGVHAAPTKEQ